VLANGIRINCERIGSGPDVVLIHGLGTNLAFWYLRSAPLMRREFRVTMYDLRGHGRSETPPSGYTPSTMAADLTALLDCLGVETAHLVGHSFGGIIALEFALRVPGRVASLTIADARLDAFQPALPLKDWPHFETWKKRLQRSGLPVPHPEDKADYHLLAQQRLAAKTGHSPIRAQNHLPKVFSKGEGRVAQSWLRLLESTTARVDFRAPTPSIDRLRQLVNPTLAIFGARSHCLPTCHGLGTAIGCRTVIIPRVGHFFPFRRPRPFVAALREFLLRVTQPEATLATTIYDGTVRTILRPVNE
jgi:pimeloyl-ACP methyl ester carboxylesterase